MRAIRCRARHGSDTVFLMDTTLFADRQAGSMANRSCVFCDIVSGAAPARVVHRDDRTIAFLDIGQAAPGHTLVVPRSHVRNLLDCSPDLAGSVFAATSDVARLLADRLHPDGITVFQANEPAGWQDVFHLHVHIVPRWTGDALVRPWKSAGPTREEVLEATLQKIITPR
jgi:histidine triad (HIT) family protein